MCRKGRTGVFLVRIAAVLVLAILLIESGAIASETVSLSLFGPETFARDSGSPTAVSRNFVVASTQGSFVLKVMNGTGTGDNAVSSAVVKLNGVAIVKTSDFSQQTTSLERPVTNLVKGANSLEVEVRSIPSSYITVSVGGTYLLGVTIADPIPSTSLSSDKTTVRGSWVGYTTDVGVAVNGVPAAISGNGFAATDVPLMPGSNTLTATVTTFDGIRNVDAVTVTATGQKPPLSLWANYASGVAPLDVAFRPETEGIAPVEYRYDFDGNGTVDKVETAGEAVAYTYTAPGTYRAAVTAVDGSGQSQTAEKTVVVTDRSAVDPLLSGRWTALSASLQNQDVSGGLVNLLPESRTRYQQIFSSLLPELPTIFGSVSPPQLIAVEGNVAQYRVRREQLWEGQMRMITYYVWFVRDTDGLWRIDKF